MTHEEFQILTKAPRIRYLVDGKFVSRATAYRRRAIGRRAVEIPEVERAMWYALIG